MKVLLRQDHEFLGKSGEVLEVKAGFARNYLIPNKIAMEMNKGNLKAFEVEQKRIIASQKREEIKATELKTKLAEVSVTASVTVGEDDRIFGTVTTANIADLLTEKGYSIDKKNIVLEEQVKALGIYPVKIKLHPAVEAEIKLWVVKG